MLGNRVTLKDVAKRAGVHPSTASRALNSASGRTSERTVQRVMQAAAALGYEPDQLARSLKTKQTFLVGVAVPDLLNAVFPAVVRGLEAVLGEAGYIVILANTDGDTARERASVRAMTARQVDGLILMTSQLRSSLVNELAGLQIPLVLIGRVVDGIAMPAVAGDDAAGVFDAVDHLAGLGHSRIAHIAGPQDTSTGRDRYHGYLAGLRERGLELDPSLVVVAQAYDEISGARACRELLGWTRDFTAIAAASDGIAFGCFDALAEAELVIPRDVSVAGFGGLPSSLRTGPPLTTVAFPYAEIGRLGGELLLAAILGENVPREVVRLKGQLVVRGSTGPPVSQTDVSTA
jgi:LacI family transcriptional regulator